MRTRYFVVNNHDLDALLSLADAMADALPDQDRERAQEGIQLARDTLLEFESPFLRHRDLILGKNSTARRLQALTLHLWNDTNPAPIASIFGNADTLHTRVALEMIASYARLGEGDPDFMRLADEIRDMRAAEKAEGSALELVG